MTLWKSFILVLMTSTFSEGQKAKEAMLDDRTAIVKRLEALLKAEQSENMLMQQGGGGRSSGKGSDGALREGDYEQLALGILDTATDNILTLRESEHNEENVMNFAQMKFGRKINLGRSGGMEDLTWNPVLNDLGCQGSLPLKCNANSRFRTTSGICNNLQNVLWGSSSSPFARFLPAQYADGRNRPRGRLDFNHTILSMHPPNLKSECLCSSDPTARLPSARLITQKFKPVEQGVDHNLTYTFTQFGQFLDHDLTLTVENPVENCCTSNRTNEECFNIKVPKGDSTFKGCLAFARSTTFCHMNHTIREQVNAVSHFVDCSTVYGSNTNLTRNLRAHTRGRMKMSSYGLAPKLQNEKGKAFFEAGDNRARMVPGLLGFHTVFLREHNRIASFFEKSFPGWNDEEIYQQTRRLLIAQMQKFVYTNYLQIVLGNDTMTAYKLHPDPNTDQYDEMFDPSIRNSFSAAAFRFGHSMISGEADLYNLSSNKWQSNYWLRDNFFKTSKYAERNSVAMEEAIFGQMFMSSEKLDTYFADDIGNHLFENILKVGSDLPARNIQRGRDHGVPEYNLFRQFCGMERACSWTQTPEEISEEAWRQLSMLYNAPSDVDLYTAGLAEKPYKDGLVGRTFNCIIARQFQALKFGDRFFYTLQDNHAPQRFTVKQVELLAKRTLGDVICDNTKIPQVPKNVFLSNSPWIRCGEHYRMDLSDFLPC